MIDNDMVLRRAVWKQHPGQVLFATVTGSRAFGCASLESDYDVHGAHLLSVEEVLRLDYPSETFEQKFQHPGNDLEIDMATHDLRKFVTLLLKGNGNVLEDLYSPLVVLSSEFYDELRELGRGCITKQVAFHYKGMAYNQQRRMKANELKKYLHMYRCLLMGIHLMGSGHLVMNLPDLTDEYGVPAVHGLIAAKRQGFDYVDDDAAKEHMSYIQMLTAGLDDAQARSSLPATATTREPLEQLVIRARLEDQGR